jgi:hypothetical protein
MAKQLEDYRWEDTGCLLDDCFEERELLRLLVVDWALQVVLVVVLVDFLPESFVNVGILSGKIEAGAHAD